MGITIKDIANAAEVSFSTVSKALNDSPLVKPETKSKILKVAEDLGYEPNFIARRLVTKQTKTIGLVWPTVERAALSTLVTRINEEIEAHSYSMILSVNPVNSAVDMFKRFQVDGIIVFEENNNCLESDFSSNIPVISYGVLRNHSIPFIDVNYKKAMYYAVDYLFHLGHKRISYIGDSSPVDQRQLEKYKGFLEAMEHFELPIREHSFINTEGLDWYDGYMATNRLLTSSCRPSAVIGGSYDISSGIIRALREANLKIPEDISVVGYDNIPQMANLETPLTSIGVPVDKLAEKIVDSLLQQFNQPNSIPLVQTLNPALIKRASCGQAGQNA